MKKDTDRIIILLDNDLYDSYKKQAHAFLDTMDREYKAHLSNTPKTYDWKKHWTTNIMPVPTSYTGELELPTSIRIEITGSNNDYSMLLDLSDLLGPSKYKPLRRMTDKDLAHEFRYLLHFTTMGDALDFADIYIRQLQFGCINWNFGDFEEVAGNGELEVLIIYPTDMDFPSLGPRLSTSDGVVCFFELGPVNLYGGLGHALSEMAKYCGDNDPKLTFGAAEISNDRRERMACIFRKPKEKSAIR